MEIKPYKRAQKKLGLLIATVITLLIPLSGCVVSDFSQDYSAGPYVVDRQSRAALNGHELDLSGDPIVFIDSEVFDHDLSEYLSEKHPQVKVIFAGQVDINNLPERLNRWFVHLKRGGGRLERVPASLTRGFFSEVVEIALDGVEHLERVELMAPAKYYDAFVNFRYDGTLESVVWKIKKKYSRR